MKYQQNVEFISRWFINYYINRYSIITYIFSGLEGWTNFSLG